LFFLFMLRCSLVFSARKKTTTPPPSWWKRCLTHHGDRLTTPSSLLGTGTRSTPRACSPTGVP
jgi:hypothetical protein